METKFTKGEWLIDCTDDSIELYPNHLPIVNGVGNIICLIGHDLLDFNVDEYAANAKLIASAPNLLKSLVCLVKENHNLINYVVDQGYIDWEDKTIDGIKDMDLAIKMAYDAIKKTTE